MLLLRKLSYFIIMTNFNGINPWINMLNNLNSIKNKVDGSNAQTQSTQNTGQNTEQITSNMQMLQNLSTRVFEKSSTNFLNTVSANQAEQSTIQDVLKMNNEVVQKYLQSLLDMPESLDKFLQNANSKNTDIKSYQFLKIFVENMLNNKELNQLLAQNSKEAIQKLLNVITQTLKHNGSDVTQLKEIMAVLNTIQTSSTINTNTLRELFLLYIPINYQVFNEDGDFGNIASDNEEEIKESTLSIMFETYSFSNVLAILQDNDGIITAEIRANKSFPFDKFKNIVTTASKDSSIKVVCDFLEIKENSSSAKKQNFKIISNDYVPINVLNVSQIIIKTLFKLDEDIKNAV